MHMQALRAGLVVRLEWRAKSCPAPARRSLYALLMLLPQSDAFKTLHARLHSVPPMALLHPASAPADARPARPPPDPPRIASAAERDPAPSSTNGDGGADGGAGRRVGAGRDSGAGDAAGDGGEAGGAAREGPGAGIEFGPLLALFRSRQRAVEADEETRRAAAHEAAAGSTGAHAPR